MQKVTKGFGTWAGVVGALAGFLTALAVFMDTFDQLDPLAGIAPLAAAAGVLWKVIDGRMKQATALAAKDAPSPVQIATSGSTSSWTTNVTWTSPRPGVDYSADIPGGSVPVPRDPANPE